MTTAAGGGRLVVALRLPEGDVVLLDQLGGALDGVADGQARAEHPASCRQRHA
jgi:hypothetical protein